jgi:hypothetical protein
MPAHPVIIIAVAPRIANTDFLLGIMFILI